MNISEILYEPLPIGRLGIRRKDQTVIVAKDFSCFAYMLEEYISLGAVHIIIPSSSPEKATVEQMPALLRKRIKIVDDAKEVEAVERLLFTLRREFGITMKEGTGQLKFPKAIPKELIEKINKVHSDVKRLALGFNHKIQIGIGIKTSIAVLRTLRTKVRDSNSRIVLSQLEA
jgi:hypothetical protein